jgi:hypothetical protein
VNDPRILPFVTDILKKAIESTLKDNNTEIRRNYVDKQNAGEVNDTMVTFKNMRLLQRYQKQ